MGLWLTLSEPVARSERFLVFGWFVAIKVQKKVKPWLPQYRSIVVVELSIDSIHWSWGRNLTTFGLQPNRCDQAVFQGSEPPLNCIYQSQQKSKDLPKPFFTVKIHKTHLQKSGTQLAGLRSVNDSSGTCIPCGIFSYCLGKKHPKIQSSIVSQTGRQHTSNLHMSWNDHYILLMEEILHHLGCIKPCK